MRSSSYVCLAKTKKGENDFTKVQRTKMGRRRSKRKKKFKCTLYLKVVSLFEVQLHKPLPPRASSPSTTSSNCFLDHLEPLYRELNYCGKPLLRSASSLTQTIPSNQTLPRDYFPPTMSSYLEQLSRLESLPRGSVP